MKIARHNYETFFLLYVDNELSAAEREAVDDFVASNPDLEEEFVMLQQSILKTDHIVFDAKQLLFKNETGADEQQEKLLLHLDNEISPAEITALTALIKTDNGIKEEWNILQQTKITPDTSIVFKHKKSLYRKEEENKVVPFPWMRLAVAAVFFGFVIWGGIAYVNNGKHTADSGIASADGNQPAAIKPPVSKEQQAQQAAQTKKEDKENAIVQAQTTKEPVEPAIIKEEKVLDKISNKKNKLPKPQLIASNTPPTNNLPEPYFNNINKTGGNKLITANVTPEKQRNNMVDPGKHVAENGPLETSETTNPLATNVTLIDNDDKNNNDRVLFMDEEKVKKTKLGGIFRKVKRVFERNANIKEGDKNIRVANLEFAIQ